MNENLHRVRKAMQLTQEQMAQKLGYKGAPGYSRLETSDGDIPENKLIILEKLGVNIHFLKTGQGEMFTGSESGAQAASQHKTDLPAMTDINPINRNLYEELIKSQATIIELLEEKNKKLEDELKRCCGEKKKEGAA